MAKEELIKMSGKVTEVLPNATFKVGLAGADHTIIATLGGKLRKFNIQILLGDSVEIEMSPYDLNRGRIVYRRK
jgi:translation initiation factor IF-1